MRLHYLQHVPIEDPGVILDWAKERGHAVSHTRFYADGALPCQDDFDWLVVMGGPMNVYEEELYPWLAPEKEFLRAAVAAGKVVLGFCLGGQLIADAIGGAVTRNGQPEIGWFPIRWRQEALEQPLFSFFPPEPVVLQWHYDTFSRLPDGAVVLAGSPACTNQAFVYRERVFGFQFHMEITDEMVRAWTEGAREEMIPAATVQSPAEVTAHPEQVAANNRWLKRFLTLLEEREGKAADGRQSS
jgi:GMP synthase-like glutamine amidotransferase